MPRGDSWKRHWEKYRNGEVELSPNHGKRGSDNPTSERQLNKPGNTLAKRYYERTGRDIIADMEQQRVMIDMMFDLIPDIDDPSEALKALKTANDALAKFNNTFAPYLEQKLSPMKSNAVLEDQITLDDALNSIEHSKKIEITDETE